MSHTEREAAISRILDDLLAWGLDSGQGIFEKLTPSDVAELGAQVVFVLRKRLQIPDTDA